MSNTEKIFVNAGHHATLHYGSKSVDGTLQEIIVNAIALPNRMVRGAYIGLDVGRLS